LKGGKKNCQKLLVLRANKIIIVGELKIMSYDEQIKNNKSEALFAETAGGTFKFSEKSPFILGKFLRYDIYRKRPWSKPSVIYVVDTDHGESMFFLGGATDRIIKNSLIPGQVYSFLFLGKKKTNRGREMNNFRIEHILDVPREPGQKPIVRRKRKTTNEDRINNPIQMKLPAKKGRKNASVTKKKN